MGQETPQNHAAEPSPLGGRYADALASLVADDENLQRLAEAARSLSDAVVSDEDASRYWQSLSVPTDEKRKLLERALEAIEPPEALRGFVHVLVEQERVGALPEIVAALDEVVAERLGRVVAVVTSAHPLTDEQTAAIGERLARRSGKDVQLRAEIDEDLVGGVRVRIGNEIIDDTVLGRLSALAKAFG